jgi:hypothetical protein
MNMNIIPTNVPGLSKDVKTGAILNIDNAKLAAYKKQKAILIENKYLDERINKIENSLDELKILIKEMLKRD